MFEKVFGVVKEAMINVLDTVTRPNLDNFFGVSHGPQRLLAFLNVWEKQRAYKLYVQFEKFDSFVDKVDRAIESAMDRYGESGNYVTKILKEQRDYVTRRNVKSRRVNLFYKICKPQPRGAGYLKVLLREKKKIAFSAGTTPLLKY